MRRNGKEQGIELVGILQHAHPATIGLSRNLRSGIEVGVDRPAVGRHFRNTVPSGQQVLPKLLDVFGFWKLARHSNDGDRRPFIRDIGGDFVFRPGHSVIPNLVVRVSDHRDGLVCFDWSRLCGIGQGQTDRFHLQQKIAHRAHGWMRVDLGYRDREAEHLIEFTRPGDADDGIQSHVEEGPIILNVLDLHLEFVRQGFAEDSIQGRRDILGRRGVDRRGDSRLFRDKRLVERGMDGRRHIVLTNKGRPVHRQFLVKRLSQPDTQRCAPRRLLLHQSRSSSLCPLPCDLPGIALDFGGGQHWPGETTRAQVRPAVGLSSQ